MDKGLLLGVTEQWKFLLQKKNSRRAGEGVQPLGNPRSPFGEVLNSPRALSGNSCVTRGQACRQRCCR